MAYDDFTTPKWKLLAGLIVFAIVALAGIADKVFHLGWFNY